ncbi:MAG: pantoate--beta-alanine ligase, partial [Gammaproteobacteria bacterium]|nr:pantoate--beta-alanine ligase [Gammaproteobacteria bacterium]
EFEQLEKTAKKALQKVSLKPDYFHVCDADTLQPPSPVTSHLAILAAAYIGKSRLIDNIRFKRS